MCTSSIRLNNKEVPFANEAKYLGMTLDAKLRWKSHVKKKREELDFKYSKMYWLLGRNSSLSTYNKLLLYRQILRPVWLYGIQLWGCARKSNINTIQKFQNKVLRNAVNAPYFVRNSDLHRDLQMEEVDVMITKAARNHEETLHNHQNIQALHLIDNSNTVRRLKRKKPTDLV